MMKNMINDDEFCS